MIKLTKDYVSKVNSLESELEYSENIKWSHIGEDNYVFEFSGDESAKWQKEKFNREPNKIGIVEFTLDDIYEITGKAITDKEVAIYDKILLDYLIKLVFDEDQQ